jgi:hypothetical protein
LGYSLYMDGAHWICKAFQTMNGSQGFRFESTRKDYNGLFLTTQPFDDPQEFSVARRTVHQMLPVLVSGQILQTNGAGGKISDHITSRASLPLRVRIIVQ